MTFTGQVILAIKMVVQVIILNLPFHIVSTKCSPGLTPIDQSAKRITAEQVMNNNINKNKLSISTHMAK